MTEITTSAANDLHQIESISDTCIDNHVIHATFSGGHPFETAGAAIDSFNHHFAEWVKTLPEKAMLVWRRMPVVGTSENVTDGTTSHTVSCRVTALVPSEEKPVVEPGNTGKVIGLAGTVGLEPAEEPVASPIVAEPVAAAATSEPTTTGSTVSSSTSETPVNETSNETTEAPVVAETSGVDEQIDEANLAHAEQVVAEPETAA